MSGKEHARLLGLLMLIYAGFQAVILIFAGVAMTFMFGTIMSQFSNMPQRPGEPRPEEIFPMMGVMMIFIFGFALLLLIPQVIAGLGLRKEKSSAKIWAIIASIIALLNFPLGTALGIYGLWFIFGAEGKNYFGGSGFSQTPPPNNWA